MTEPGDPRLSGRRRDGGYPDGNRSGLLALVVALGLQAAAQAADLVRDVGAVGHVRALVGESAAATGQLLGRAGFPYLLPRRYLRSGDEVRPGDVVLAPGEPGQQWRQRPGENERDHRAERRGQVSEGAEEGGDADHGGHEHRAEAHRVDAVEVRTLELDVRRAPAQRLVDDQIGTDGGDPGD